MGGWLRMFELSPSEWAAIVQAIAAVFTFLAAIVAVYITWLAPQRAARLAERLRVLSEREQGRRKEKLRILRTLMNHRGAYISSRESFNALNMIGIAYHDSPLVEAAFEKFLLYINGAENAENRSRAYIDIIVEMAKALNFPETISHDSINRGYFPLPPPSN